MTIPRKNPKKIHRNISKAFSLVEISVAIVIIGILIAGISKGIDLYKEFKLTSARNLTTGSIVNRIPNVVLWYEPTMPQSFINSEVRDGADISRWHDISQKAYKNHAYAGQRTNSNGISYNAAPSANSGNTKGPIYIANGINDLPTLQFRNQPTSEYRYLVPDANSRVNSIDDLTLIVVMRHISGSGHIIDRQCMNNNVPVVGCSNYADPPQNTIPVGTPLFGILLINSRDINVWVRYNDNSIPSSSGSNYDTGYDVDKSKAMILTFQRKYNKNFQFYFNGKNNLSALINDWGKMINLQPMKIGRHANFENESSESLNIYISEIIYIAGNISDTNRDAIEDYLGKKYAIAVSH